MPDNKPMDERHFFYILRLPTVLFIVVSNFLVLAGALIWGWDLLTMMLVFWLESAIIGFYTVLKLFSINLPVALVTLPFYLFHFGCFLAVYLVAVLTVFAPPPARGQLVPLLKGAFFNAPVLIGAAPLFISHGVSFYRNFWPRRALWENKLNDIAFEPYPRIMLWCPVLVVAAAAVHYLGGGRPQYGYPVVILVKACADIWSHLNANGLNPWTRGRDIEAA
ncbi:MAG: DUF6498-containing protein [Elusimicrobiales bacterium]|nr:DUF6498-containing protein [Elusimicrobiales bacterium]